MDDIKLEGRIEFLSGYNQEYNRDFTAVLSQSAAFEYGNGTCVRITWRERIYEPIVIDTRYDRTIAKTPNGFKLWLTNYFKKNYQSHKLIWKEESAE